jgi:probable rRNA maturation factor
MEDDPAYDIAIVRVSASVEDRSIADASLIEAVKAALVRHNTPTAQISVALVDDSQMAELNLRHLNHEGPTDVLTFDLRDDDDNRPAGQDGPAGGGLEGEIVVSVDTAAREARRRGHEVDAEASLYAVHGTLHLLGYDDRREQDAVRMHTVEDEILSSLGMGSVFGAKPL